MFTFSGTRKNDIRETLGGIKSLGVTPEAILMISGIVEAFDHTNKGLQPLRDAVPGYGVDTTNGRTYYNQLIFDGLVHIDNRINDLGHTHPV